MLPRNHPDRIQITFDDRRLVAGHVPSSGVRVRHRVAVV